MQRAKKPSHASVPLSLRPERREGRGETEKVSLQFRLKSIPHNFTGDGYFGSKTTVPVSNLDFQTKKLKHSFIVMVYSALFNYVIKALNLFFFIVSRILAG
jgi:hypothetical protein